MTDKVNKWVIEAFDADKWWVEALIRATGWTIITERTKEQRYENESQQDDT
jgi:hypothetical protein